ncbi:MAG: NAD(P)H-hydrate dehydratase [Gammaproteobacteria bacterium]|nr:NAD(P)H-hydrate dehydratase [Gammaproteobacteria bacterium]
MPNLPANIYSVAAVRETDRTAIEDHGVPGCTLMARAAAAAMREVRQRFPDARRWQIICGAGNNGGDGYVMARLAAHDGIVVSVLTLVDVDKLTGDAATAWGDFTAEGGVVMPWAGDLDDQADLLVDGILGSGLEREVSGDFADAVARINAHPAPVVSLDIPTGIHGDTGKVLGTAVRADMTVTFVGLKSGLFLGDAPAHCGAIRFADLEIPESYRSEIAPAFRCIDDLQLAAALKPRARGAHKGDFGHVLVIGGGQGMPGAIRLAGEAALRAGAGRVSIATHPSHAAILVATRPELMSHGVTGAADLAPLLENADVVALGPGLGQSEWAQALYDEVAESPLPAVWDADALNLLAKTPNNAHNRVITPHPGEAATLLNTSTADIQADRPAALAALAEKYGGTAVLKGSGSLVSTDSTPVLCVSGNPGMAAPGMGDVLTGIVAGLLAQGLNMTDAAAIGVEAHARAGDRAALAGERGMLASDLMAELRAVLNP